MLENWDHEKILKRSNTKPRDIHKYTVEALKCNYYFRLRIKKLKYQRAVEIWILTLPCKNQLETKNPEKWN